MTTHLLNKNIYPDKRELLLSLFADPISQSEDTASIAEFQFPELPSKLLKGVRLCLQTGPKRM